jgi:hypothetical protein
LDRNIQIEANAFTQVQEFRLNITELDGDSSKSTVRGLDGDTWPSSPHTRRSQMRPSSLVMAFVLGLIVSPIVFPDGFAPQLHRWVEYTRSQLPVRNDR